MTTRKTGRCLCGAVRFTADLPDLHARGCHCADCRRWGGTVYVVGPVPDVAFNGAEAIVTHRTSDWAERAFCGVCGSNLYWRALNNDAVTLMIGTFDDISDFTLISEIFSDERLPFLPPGHGAAQRPRAEVIDRYRPGTSYDGVDAAPATCDG